MLAFIFVITVLGGNEIDEESRSFKRDVPDLLQMTVQADSLRKAFNEDAAARIYEFIVDQYDDEMLPENAKICSQACLNLGNIYSEIGEYTKALDYLIKGIRIVENLKKERDGKLLAYMYLKAGNVYSVFEDHEKALANYNEGLKYAVHNGDTQQEAIFLNCMMAASCYIKAIDKAKEYNRLAASLPLKDTIKQLYYKNLNDGFIAMAEDKLYQAILSYKKSITYAKKVEGEPMLLAASYSEIYKIYEESDDLDSAVYYLEKYKDITESEHLTYMQVDSYKNLSRLYAKMNEQSNSLYYQNKYVLLADSLMNKREFNRVRNKQFAYEKNKSTNYINRLNTTITTQQIILVVIGAFLLVIISLLVKIYLQKHQLQTAYEDLFERNKELVNAENKYLAAIKSLGATAEVAGKEDEQQHRTSGLKEEQREDLLKKVVYIMESTSDFCNPDFSLAELASKVDSNTKYVSQIINETYGINFRSFINEYRIKLSRKRLTDIENYGHYTIKAIAESVGFKSQSNFIVSFRKITGITPSLYQKMAQKDKIQS